MKRITLILLFLISVSVVAQKKEKKKKREYLESYTASNGVEYKVGDKITLNIGSGNNGKFVYITTRSSDFGRGNMLSAGSAGRILKITKIKKLTKKQYEGMSFTVATPSLKPFIMDIENAIRTCEITPCEEKTNGVIVQEPDKYDKLAKLKELFDQGVLSEEEYEKEKKKLLESGE